MSTATQASLLDRLRDGADPLAWQEFYGRYWRALYAFATRRGCSEQTAEDVVQDVMVAVFENRLVFRYDPARGRYRNWLLTLVRQKIALRRREQAHERRPIGGEEGDGIPELAAAEDRPDEAWDAAFEGSLLLALLDTVRREVSPETYQAFELTTLYGLPGAEAAQITGLTRNAVYLARQRVLQRLRELGAPYAEDGQLDPRVKEALALCPTAAGERSLTARVDATLGARKGPAS
jgi:RNA polymerase sigma-70 factor (ECF subfamily)